ncbi:MAG: hypothetical protein LBR11_00860 [Deltaproteobacteria bacterium]|jgi:flavodoxin|nr:hypothetical protein [Deltaproteobacteria bacterium]
MKSAFKTIYLIALLGALGLVASPTLAELSPTKDPSPFGQALIIYYSQTGVTDKVARQIQSLIGGDLLLVETERTLPKEEKAIIDAMKNNWREKIAVPTKTPAPDVAKYDTVFVGSAVWFAQPALPMQDFLNKMDFLGKKVIVFGTSGSGPGQAYDLLAQSIKNGQVLPGGKIFDRQTLLSEDLPVLISAWLTDLRSRAQKSQ